MRHLKTAADVIDALGGTTALAADLGLNYRRVHNWRGYIPYIPSMYYPYMHKRLRQEGCTAPPALWGVFAPRGFKLDAS